MLAFLTGWSRLRLGRGGKPLFTGRGMAIPARVAVTAAAVAAGVGLTGASTAPASPDPAGTTVAAPADLYVSNATAAGCSDSGTGIAAQPFCTISAAARAVQAGQTVIVEPGFYDESVSVTTSGTASAPVTFLANDNSPGIVQVAAPSGTGNAFVLSGVQNVILRGFDVSAASGYSFLVENSADITIDGGAASATGGSAAVRVTGTSSNVTVSRATIVSVGPGVEADAGATGVSVAADTMVNAGLRGNIASPGVLVADAPGAEVTSNTLITKCSPGVVVSGTSPGAAIENNIVETAADGASAPAACTTPANATAISVSTASVPQTVADYNLIDPASGGALYAWNGVSYTGLATFTSDTGQGAHDIAASPQLGPEKCCNLFYFPLNSTSPAIDSANADAPGEPATDMLGNARADDPAVANTGTGIGYFDRGAVEAQGSFTYGDMSMQRAAGGGPLDVVASAHLIDSWTTNGPVGAYEYDFGDGPYYVNGLPLVTTATSAEHSFLRAGDYCGVIRESPDGFRTTASGVSACVVVGADYTPVRPTRILNTRTGLGATGPIAPGASVVLPIPAIAGVPAAEMSAVVANVTVSGETASGGLSVYPHRDQADSPDVWFAKGRAVSSLVTVGLGDNSIVFHNASKGSVQVTADVDGFYGAGAYGFKPLRPVRVLDTRQGIGAPAVAVGPYSQLRLNLTGKAPAGTAAAVFTVTVTQPKASGSLTVYPDGQTRPSVSNLRFSAGAKVSNLVIVPLGNDEADFYNGSDGTVEIVADLAGYFGTAAIGAADSYVPDGPALLADTRNGSGYDHPLAEPIPAYHSLTLNGDWHTGCGACAYPTAWVWTVTATQPKAAGYLVVYPGGETRPNTCNLHFGRGQTVADLATVANALAPVIYNRSDGSVEMVVDQQGYYIGPP